MDLYQAVLSSVTARMAAENAGLEISRNGMAVCPFHNDHDPSLKLDRRYHCFGCGADGDAISFTARLYNLSRQDAAEKLAQDFGLSYDHQEHSTKPQKIQRHFFQDKAELRTKSYRIISDYYRLLQKWEKDYAPKDLTAPWHPRFTEALQRKSEISSLLDQFIARTPDENNIWIAEHKQDLKAMEQRRYQSVEDQKTIKEKLKEITDSIETGIRDLFESDKYKNYLKTMGRFHKYSLNNTMLIYMQKPDATMVAGYNKWKNQLGRHVKKGERGITIIAPTPYKKTIEKQKLDPDTKIPMIGPNGEAIMETKEIQIPMFRPVKVFDLSQTDGKPLPQLVSTLTGDVQNYDTFMEALKLSAPVPLEFETMDPSMDGYFSPAEQRIALRIGMSEVQTISAAVHEITHSKLHNLQIPTEKEQWKIELVSEGGTRKLFEGGFNTQEAAEQQAADMNWEYKDEHEFVWRLDVTEDTPIQVFEKKDRRTQEVEAESVSYAVCQYYGIETGDNSLGYIASWSKDKQLPELKASLELINRTAGTLISDIDQHYTELCKEQARDLLENDAKAAVPPEEAITEVRVLPNPQSHNELDRSILQVFSLQNGEELSGEVLGSGRTEQCRELAEKLNQRLIDPETVKKELAAEAGRWHCYIIPDLMSWNHMAGKDLKRTPIELYSTYEEALARFQELRGQAYNQEITDNLQSGLSYARLTFGVQRENPPSAADLLHVRGGQNYLVDDFTRMEALNTSADVMDVLHKLQSDVGFDRLIFHEKDAQGQYLPPADLAFNQWENPYFKSAAAPSLDQYPMPDPDFIPDRATQQEYREQNLLPLSRTRAKGLSEKGLPVTLQENDVSTISRTDWEASAEFHQMILDRLDHQQDREAAFRDYPKDCFAIYQVVSSDPDNMRFMDWDWQQENEIPVTRDRYDLIYTAPLTEAGSLTDQLEHLYEKFNMEHPADYHSRSMSVSDIVAVKQDGIVTCHYVDSVGFKPVPGFLPDNPLKNAEMALEDDYGMIDGIINNGSKEAVSKEDIPKKSIISQLKDAPKQERRKTAPRKSKEKEI